MFTTLIFLAHFDVALVVLALGLLFVPLMATVPECYFLAVLVLINVLDSVRDAEHTNSTSACRRSGVVLPLQLVVDSEIFSLAQSRGLHRGLVLLEDNTITSDDSESEDISSLAPSNTVLIADLLLELSSAATPPEMCSDEDPIGLSPSNTERIDLLLLECELPKVLISNIPESQSAIIAGHRQKAYNALCSIGEAAYIREDPSPEVVAAFVAETIRTMQINSARVQDESDIEEPAPTRAADDAELDRRAAFNPSMLASQNTPAPASALDAPAAMTVNQADVDAPLDVLHVEHEAPRTLTIELEKNDEDAKTTETAEPVQVARTPLTREDVVAAIKADRKERKNRLKTIMRLRTSCIVVEDWKAYHAVEVLIWDLDDERVAAAEWARRVLRAFDAKQQKKTKQKKGTKQKKETKQKLERRRVRKVEDKENVPLVVLVHAKR